GRRSPGTSLQQHFHFLRTKRPDSKMRAPVRLHLGADRISSLQFQNRSSLTSAFMVAYCLRNPLSLKAYQNIRSCQRSESVSSSRPDLLNMTKQYAEARREVKMLSEFMRLP